MKNSITLTRQDLEKIHLIAKENDIQGVFDLVMTSGSGIGFTIDMEFPQEVNGREAVVRIEISGVENW